MAQHALTDAPVGRKYLLEGDRLIATPRFEDLSPGSWLIASLIARGYERVIPTYCRGVLLDLGCGRSPLRPLYSRHVTRSLLLDWKQSPGAPINVVADISGPLPIADASFDTIILSDVLEHVPTPHALWREMYRVLRPNGRVLLNVPFLYWLHETPHDYFRYTSYGLRRLARDTGFSVESLEPLGGSVEVMTDIVSKHLACAWGVGPRAAHLLQRLVLRLMSTSLGRRVTARSAAKFPLAYLMIARKAC